MVNTTIDLDPTVATTISGLSPSQEHTQCTEGSVRETHTFGVVWQPHSEHIARLKLERVEAVRDLVDDRVELLETPSQVLLDAAKRFLVRQALDGFVEGATDGTRGARAEHELRRWREARQSRGAKESEHAVVDRLRALTRDDRGGL